MAKDKSKKKNIPIPEEKYVKFSDRDVEMMALRLTGKGKGFVPGREWIELNLHYLINNSKVREKIAGRLRDELMDDPESIRSIQKRVVRDLEGRLGSKLNIPILRSAEEGDRTYLDTGTRVIVNPRNGTETFYKSGSNSVSPGRKGKIIANLDYDRYRLIKLDHGATKQFLPNEVEIINQSEVEAKRKADDAKILKTTPLSMEEFGKKIRRAGVRALNRRKREFQKKEEELEKGRYSWIAEEIDKKFDSEYHKMLEGVNDKEGLTNAITKIKRVRIRKEKAKQKREFQQKALQQEIKPLKKENPHRKYKTNEPEYFYKEEIISYDRNSETYYADEQSDFLDYSSKIYNTKIKIRPTKP